MADTFEDLDLFATVQGPQMPATARATPTRGNGHDAPNGAPAPASAPTATFLRPHTRYHAEILVPGDPPGIIRVISNERLKEFGL